MRLQKYLAMCGVASRRKAEEYIQVGKVKVNNEVITEMGYQVDPVTDEVIFDGKVIEKKEEPVYVLLNKPKGYVTTLSDEFDRKIVTDLVDVPQRIFPVGRLDLNTTGLLILTNDGDLTYRLTHPRFKVEKIYVSRIKGRPYPEKIKAFETGLEIEDYVTSPAKFRIIRHDGRNTIVEIIIREGRNRQIRKMCDAIGHPVIDLKRVAMGRLDLGELGLGQWRFLNQREIKYLKNL
ncbi:pseudouridine synthase [Alkaliphilus hydrothermalis]|uniref:Pseudouridine synthase n=1 Tax=Alkaliphilus hydrothermalis TaxID=1482730 RepID=A0ABS2NMC7_9FIRM|nr:pseudouridine synthase [Alkaliphilus hydrothermalis]MBM7614083.1 23S rRNA pseudouridine2605 synthase [Alkaliphilus hydrothermalis]